jgi:hypothetical protein
MGEVRHAQAGEPQTGQAGPLRLVSSPSAPTGQGAARRAQATRARPLQLLRRQRHRSESAAARRSHEAGLGHMAVPSQPAHALDVGEVWRRAPAVPLPRPRITVRIWGGSPRVTSTEEPDGGNLLVRIWRGAGVGNLPAYSTTAFCTVPPLPPWQPSYTTARARPRRPTGGEGDAPLALPA